MMRVEGISQAAADARYAPQATNLVQPIAVSFGRAAEASALGPGEKTIRAVRALVPKTGILRALSVFVKTKSGNLILAALSTAGTRKTLYSSGSVAVGTAETWQSVEPELAVTAGQHLDLALMIDNATATFAGEAVGISTAINTLPSGFLPSQGALPKLAWSSTQGSFAFPTEVSEASCAASSQFPYILARIV